MARVCVFADEFGNFDFRRKSGASRYFGLTTVTFFDDQQARADLQQLRFDLAWEGVTHSGPFRATTDQQAIRDRVFEVLNLHCPIPVRMESFGISCWKSGMESD